MARRITYAWYSSNTGKFYLSVVQAGDEAGYRPRNEYDNRAALEAEAAQRRLAVTWEWEGNGS